MKTWNTPNVEVLSINETANGHFDTWFETWFIHNDSNAPQCPCNPDPIVDPGKGEELPGTPDTGDTDRTSGM